MQINETDIAKIESALGFELPRPYAELLLDYPDELRETEAPDYWLFANPAEIIDHNLEVREKGYFGEEWPDQYIIIGHNGCGDYYVTRKGITEFSAGFADHEKMACVPFANTRDDFILKILEEMK